MVELTQNLLGILLGAEVYDHEIDITRHRQLLHIDALAIKRHHDRPVAVGTPLVHAPAA